MLHAGRIRFTLAAGVAAIALTGGAGDLRAQGIAVVPRPLEGDPGHAELPGLTYQDRKSDEALEWKALLAQQLCLRVEGPFPP